MMRWIFRFVALSPLLSPGALAQDSSLGAPVDRELDSLVRIYKEIHAAPELSHQERNTSSLLASQLRALGYVVTDHVGKYPNSQWHGYGIVAVLRNGAGPTVLVRADLDALPVEEQTGLPYASRARASDDSGVEVPVSHACGHDLHVTVLIGTARMLAAMKDRWHGTLVMVGQPSEEKGDGARAMLADGLYTRFPKPDLAVALHDFGELEAGTVGYTSGYMLAGATSVDVTIRGRGGHAPTPSPPKTRSSWRPNSSSRSKPSSVVKSRPRIRPLSPWAPSTEAPSTTSFPMRSNFS